MTDTVRTSRGRRLALLGGLALLALVVSPAPPRDPVLSAVLRFVTGIDPGSVTRVSALAMVVAAFVSAVLVTVMLVLGIKEGLETRKGLARKRTFKERLKDPLTAAILYLLLAAILAGTWFGMRALSDAATRAADEAARAAAATGTAAPVAGGATADVAPAAESDGGRSGWAVSVPAVLAAGAVTALCALAVAAAVRGRRKPQPAAVADGDAGLAEGLALARQRLHLADGIRDAIVACYADMCSLFADSEDPRATLLTAREFAELLRRKGAGEPEIAALTGLFERARYSDEPCGAAERDAASEALHALERRYGGSAR